MRRSRSKKGSPERKTRTKSPPRTKSPARTKSPPRTKSPTKVKKGRPKKMWKPVEKKERSGSPVRSGSPTRTRTRSPKKYTPFYKDVASIIAGYAYPRYKLRDWIPSEYVVPSEVDFRDPKAMTFFIKYLEKFYRDPVTNKIRADAETYDPEDTDRIEVGELAFNPNVSMLIDKHPEMLDIFHYANLAQNPSIDVVNLVVEKLTSEDPIDHLQAVEFELSKNPSAYEWLLENPEYIDAEGIMFNPKATDLRRQTYRVNPYMLQESLSGSLWDDMCKGDFAVDIVKDRYRKNRKFQMFAWSYIAENPAMIEIIEQELKQPDPQVIWEDICRNPGAMNILKNNMDKIEWVNLALNRNPEALKMSIERYRETEDPMILESLHSNPLAIDFFEENQDLVNWEFLMRNPEIFVLDKPRRKYVSALENLELN